MRDSDLIIEFNKSIDGLRRDIKGDFKELRGETVERISKVEIRTDGLESWRDNMMGKVAIITVIATSLVSLVISFFKDLISKNL